MIIMIQVLKRSFRILEELALDGEVSLENLARISSLNKGTLCNILKSLIELGYVSKSARGYYTLSDSFRNLCRTPVWGETESTIMKRAAEELAVELEESVVISTLRDRRVAIIAQYQFQRHLMVNHVVYYARLSLYHSVSGRVLLSFLQAEERRRLFDLYGEPGGEWDNIQDFETLETAAATIRENAFSEMTNIDEGIKSFAVPVFDREGKICAALGMTLPISRLKPDLISRLQQKAAQISLLLAEKNLRGTNLLRPF